MAACSSLKRQRKNSTDPARFVNKISATTEGEKEEIHYYLDLEKIAEEDYVSRDDQIKAHFLICFLALLHFRMLKKGIKTSLYYRTAAARTP